MNVSRLDDVRPAPCPTCRKAALPEAPAFPFCSARCRTIDLGRWIDESYRVSRPLEEADLDEES